MLIEISHQNIYNDIMAYFLHEFSIEKAITNLESFFFPKLDDSFQEEISPLSLRIQKMKTVFNLMTGLYEPYRHGQLIIMVQKDIDKDMCMIKPFKTFT